MSIALMTKAWEMELPMGEKMLLLKLADRANDDGECWPGQQALARHCSMSERAVRDNLGRLVERGILVVIHRNYGTVRKTSIYRLDLDAPQPKKCAESGAAAVAESGDSRPADSAGRCDSRPADCDIPDRQPLPVVYKEEPKATSTQSTGGGGAPPLEADSLLVTDDGVVWDDREKMFRNIAEEVFQRWDEAYRGLDVDAELARAETWYAANPKRRKRNHLRFITNWLARAHKDAKARQSVGGGQRRVAR